MTETTFGEEGGREWLISNHRGTRRQYSYPPVQGTHRECFIGLANDSEVVPAEGLDLALIAKGAYSQRTKRWADVKQRAFVSGYTRIPVRVSWMPVSHELAGAVVERDLQGNGRLTKMVVPSDVSSWKKNSAGLYVSPDGNQTLVPAGKYSAGQINEKDSLLIAHLGQEGAEMFVKTAVDEGKVPYSWVVDINKISSPEQRVSGLVELGVRLDLYANGRGCDWYGYAFGVHKSGEASTQKI
jgi:hypothetical protein